MTSQTFKFSALTVAFFMALSVSIYAQQTATAAASVDRPSMQTLIGQSLSKLQQPSSEAYLNCIAELKRIDAMFPDSIQPKREAALQSLYFSVMNPHAPQTERLLTEVGETIAKMEKMTGADQSDICTLNGFLYMVRIVQDPAQNGPRYYLDVMQNYEKALKLNPDNQLAKQLQQRFYEGMRQQTGK